MKFELEKTEKVRVDNDGVLSGLHILSRILFWIGFIPFLYIMFFTYALCDSACPLYVRYIKYAAYTFICASYGISFGLWLVRRKYKGDAEPG